MIRMLNEDDINHIDTLIKSQPKYAAMNITANKLVLNKSVTRFGYFNEDNHLLSLASIKLNQEMCCGVITLIMQRPSSFFNPFENHLSDCIDEAFNFGEKYEIYTYYSWRTLKEFKLQSKLNIWKDWPNRYIGFTECYIPPNKEPISQLHKYIVDGLKKNEWTIIRCQKLKNKYRFPNQYNRIEGDFVDV